MKVSMGFQEDFRRVFLEYDTLTGREESLKLGHYEF